MASEVRVITRSPHGSAEALPMDAPCRDIMTSSSLLLGIPSPYSQGLPRTPFPRDLSPPRSDLAKSSPPAPSVGVPAPVSPLSLSDPVEDLPGELARASVDIHHAALLDLPYASVEDVQMSRSPGSAIHSLIASKPVLPRSPPTQPAKDKDRDREKDKDKDKDKDKRGKRDMFMHRLRKKKRKGWLSNNELESSTELTSPLRPTSVTSLPELIPHSGSVNKSSGSLSSSSSSTSPVSPSRIEGRSSSRRQGLRREPPSKVLLTFMELHDVWRREEQQQQQQEQLHQQLLLQLDTELVRPAVTLSITKSDPGSASGSSLRIPVPPSSIGEPVIPGIGQRQEHKRGGRRSPRQFFMSEIADSKDRGEAEYLSLFANELSRDSFPFLEATPRAVYEMLPAVPAAPFDIRTHLEFCTFKGMNECEVAGYVYGRRESNYPMDRDGARQGDPICDAFGYLLFRDAALLTLTDGCGWGQGSANASLLTVQTYFHTFLMARSAHLASVRSLSLLMVYCLSVAHTTLSNTYASGSQMGTTTFISCMVLPVQKRKQQKQQQHQDQEEAPVLDPYVQELVHSRDRFYLITLSVGDCKAFHYSPTSRQVRDITRGNRANLCDPCDPGGRIGQSSMENSDPDLRNLSLYLTPCVEGDFVFLMSDGIHDNFDPEMLGVEPSALGLHCTEWANAPPAQVEAAKTSFMESLIGRVLTGARCSTPRQACRALLEHAASVSKTSRAFMESGQNGRLPKDYTRYPGKMDHSSVIAAIVGEKSEEERDLSLRSTLMHSTLLESLDTGS